MMNEMTIEVRLDFSRPVDGLQGSEKVTVSSSLNSLVKQCPRQ